MPIKTIEEFKSIVHEVENFKDYQRPAAFAVGVATVDSKGNMLDCYFPCPNFESNYGSAAVIAKVVGYTHGTKSFPIDANTLVEILAHFKPFENDGKHHHNIEAMKTLQRLIEHKNVTRKLLVATFIAPANIDLGPQEVPDAYLRLHLLSHRLIRPHGINLTGIFKILPNVIWSSQGAIAINELPEFRINIIAQGKQLVVYGVDKFPRMTDYVVPSGIRIADASRVRLGAYLGEGTTVMHEGFVNFNAGCEGPNMIEGRISAGVFVKKDSDLGGGCSTMGTLSGGGNMIISIGEQCLIGANAGVGIPLGNRCTVEAGLYITAGTKVSYNGNVIKAKEFAHHDDMLFRRNSQNGQVEAISKANTLELNDMLHAN